MATYNGLAYLGEQLDSLRNQTVVPDEVLICDDCSTDGSAEYVSDYIKRHSLGSWRLTVNSSNIGWKRNFYQLLEQVTCDYVCLADQDDIWLPTHIEMLADVFKRHPEATVVSSLPAFHYEGRGEIEYPDCDGSVCHPTLNCRFGITSQPGCTYMVKKTLFQKIQHDWDVSLPHDAILYSVSKMMGTLFVLNEVSVIFRRHENCASAQRKKGRSELMDELDRLERLLSLLRAVLRRAGDAPFSNQSASTLDRAERALELRQRMIAHRSFFDWLRLCSFSDCYASRKNYYCDLWCLVFKNLKIPRR
ncbi:glycosyltransferase [Adlercreutzia sp. ZJ473]|uniref:glycosyltransferase n=1 Tax=Adlercreutzia sp. ZJ473 TaxID=2722822 RepID=UPI0020A6511A|nr:glycosyltransferase [Adlercreutzia sp. ZJ473]